MLSNIEDQDEVVEPLKIYNKNSQLLNAFTPEEYQAATTGQGTFFYHHLHCVLKSSFDNSKVLPGFWNMIATSTSSLDV